MTPGVINGISVFFPAYNDALTICELVRRASDTLEHLTDDFEIVVVNDGSHDSTGELLDGLQKTMPFLRVVTHEKNRGYGAALRSGINSAGKEFVFYTDGDGQYDVGELTKLVDAMSEDVDVVNGYKLNRADGVHRKVIGGIYASAMQKLFRLPIRDVDCDFRLMRKSSLDAIELTSNSGSICVELVSKLAQGGARFVEVGVRHYPREAGRSQFFSTSRIFATLIELKGLWLNRSQRAQLPPRKSMGLNNISATNK